MDEKPKGEIENLSDTLYSRTRYQEPTDERSPVGEPADVSVNESWNSPNLDEMLQVERRQTEHSSFMRKIFIMAVIFFVAAIAVASYMFFGGGSFISTKNVDITVVGPTNIAAGDVLEFDVTVTNKNNADLEVANLSITFPQGTRNPDDTTQSLTYAREVLGAVGAGREISRNVRAIIFGERGEVKEIKFSVEYKVKGSNATFYKNKVYELSIGDTPVVMNVDLPPSVTSGEPFTATIELAANTSEVLKNLMVRGEYPYGFTLIESTPRPLTENNVWDIGDLSPGSKKTITIRGKLVGENDEERTFRFYTGVEDAGNTHTFKTTLANVSDTVAIARPSLGVSIELNGDSSSEYIAPRAQNINAEINFINNLPDKLTNVRAEARLTGAALDKLSVRAMNGGFYDSAQNKITWNLQPAENGELVPGQEGNLFFSFASLANLPSGSSNQQINIDVTVSGTSVGDGRPATVSLSRKVKIASQVTFTSKVLYSRGPFRNTGPVPPKAEKPTTYTIVWNVSNTQNDVAGATVVGTLGQNVKWVAASASGNENVVYDPSTNKVTWTMGTVTSGSGFTSTGREASFQVSLTPSLSQVGSVPVLVSNPVFSGTDTFTGKLTSASTPSMTTRMPLDPTFVQGDEVVVR